MDADGSPDDAHSDVRDFEIDARRKIFDLAERLNFDDEKGLDKAQNDSTALQHLMTNPMQMWTETGIKTMFAARCKSQRCESHASKPGGFEA